MIKRRHFLKKIIPGIGLLFLEIKQVLAQVFPRIQSHNSDNLTVYLPGKTPTSIPVWRQYDIPFVSASQLAAALNFNTFFNQDKNKLVIYLNQSKVVINPDNPFIILDGKALQMPVATIWERGELFVPLPFFIPLINKYANLTLWYNPDRMNLRFSKNNYNVSGINVSKKENGVVIRISTSQEFGIGEMTIDMRYDWLHIDLYGAKGDVDLLSKIPVKNPIREIKIFQFKDLLSAAFRLRKKPLSKDIYQDHNTKEVVVILRYKEDLADVDIPEDDPNKLEDANDIDPDIQKRLENEGKRWLIDTVVIDAGHGGKDPGAIGAKKLQEKDIVLPVALKLGKIIQRKMPKVNVVFTRKSDTFIELSKRTQIANDHNAKIFISIHANANPNKNAKGFETYILGPDKGVQASDVAARENAVIRFEPPGSQKHYQGINTILAGMAQSAFLKQSEKLAENVQKEMAKRLQSLNMKDRGVKQAGFWVIVGASMPSIIVEMGFITNKYDARILKTANYQQKIAEGIFAGLQKFKKEYESSI